MKKQTLDFENYSIITWKDFSFDSQLILRYISFPLENMDEFIDIIKPYKEVILNFIGLFGEEVQIKDKYGFNTPIDIYDLLEKL